MKRFKRDPHTAVPFVTGKAAKEWGTSRHQWIAYWPGDRIWRLADIIGEQ